MSLDDFITDEKNKTYHDNSKLDEKRIHQEHICPRCGNEAEHVRGIEWRCTADPDECDVLTYYQPEPVLD